MHLKPGIVNNDGEQSLSFFAPITPQASVFAGPEN
jgi:hypothetical protein